MSACNTFTEHVWKPGECKNCFKPKSLHHLGESGPKKGPPDRPAQLQNLSTAGGRPNANLSNSYQRGVGSGRSGHFRPPVAKKPTIAVKPTMMLPSSLAGLDAEGNRAPADAAETGKPSDYTVWNQNGANRKRPGGVNNNEGEDSGEIEGYGPAGCRLPASSSSSSSNNNNGLADVLKEIAGLGFGPGSSSSSRDLFLGRISSSYKRSLERGLPASGCLALGGGGGRGGATQKRVSLNNSTEVISAEGGRFCYPEFSSDGDEDEEESEGDEEGEHESWDESDEELLAMEIRMRGQPRFANFRAATLSPVPFALGKKWNTVPLRNRSLQRICAVDYDDSYDEILNGYPSAESNGGHILVPFGQNNLQGSGFFSTSESTTSPESSSSLPEDSQTTSSSRTSSSPGRLPNGLNSPASREPVSDSAVEKGPVQRGLRSPKATETHKAVLAIRLEERDGAQKEGEPLPQALPGQPVTISFSPPEEQAKPYRVVSLEKPPVCKPYTVVDVSASMTHAEGHYEDNAPKPKGSSFSATSASSPSSPLGHPLSPAAPLSPTSPTFSGPLNSSRKKPGSIRYQEVWTSSTSPRQKIPKVELIPGGLPSGPAVPPRLCSHKSAPTSPTTGLSSSSRTVPVKSPNLSEIKFNSYNNAGMPPFPIIIRDEPTYARGSKNAVKVPIVINPSAYDNLAVYKSFLGVSGELPQPKSGGGGRVTSHTYEEIGSSESVQTSPSEMSANGKVVAERAAIEDRKTGQVQQKIQEIHAGTSTELSSTANMAPTTAAPASTVGLAKASCSAAVSSGHNFKASGEAASSPEGSGERQPSAGPGAAHREKASAVLSQIVASIQPPQCPPESPNGQSKTYSAEELYALPPDAIKETLSRPKSLFSTADGCLSNPRKDTPSKPLPKSQSASAAAPPTSPKSEPGAPFPPPRSTSSPYHAANLLQRHFGNWTKPSSGSPRPCEAETSPGGGEGRRAAAESAKPKRWISFKSFFRRRKDEDEQRFRTERAEREKGKLVGLDGTVIHMLPPPPIQRHHWFAEAKNDDPSQKPTIIFTYRPEAGVASDGEEGDHLRVEEVRDTTQLSPQQSGEKGGKPGSAQLAKDTHQGWGDPSPATTPPPANPELSVPEETSRVACEDSASQGEHEEGGSHSHSPASSTCSATYSNLGQSRANMIPLKHPRNTKASDDNLASVELEGSDNGSKATPPPLPKKTISRANMEPSSLGKDLPTLRPKGEAKPGGTNLSVANPLYDLDSTWETASQSSSLGSEARVQDQESGDSLERPAVGKGQPANSLSCLASSGGTYTGRQKRGCRSAESLAGRGRAAGRGRGRPVLYKGVDSWEEVVGRIRGLHTDTLRKLAGRCEDRFMAGQKDPLRFGTDSWSDFRLTTGRPCCEAGDAVYYTASYAKDPLVNYAVKICRSHVKETQQQLFHSLAVRQSLALHFNIQQDCGHFLADVPIRLLPWEEAGEEQEEEEEEEEEKGKKVKDPAEKGVMKRKEKQVGQAEASPGHMGSTGRLRSRVVVITREVPFQTVADFVREGVARHNRNPDLYERQVCLLLLQLCSGLEHMKPYHVTHCDLRLENLLLVQCQPHNPWNLDVPEPNNNNSVASGACPARLIISNFSQAKQKGPPSDPGALRDQSRLAPEIVTATQYRKCDEFQTGILIYEMLHRPNPFEEMPELKEREYTGADLPPLPVRSPYSLGLQRLASLLLNANPSERIRMAEARACLQCLLWGPREDLFQALSACPGRREATLQNWLDLKRTLMMIKFAERSLDAGCGVSLEDWLCCQYLAFSTTDTLARVVGILQPPPVTAPLSSSVCLPHPC